MEPLGTVGIRPNHFFCNFWAFYCFDFGIALVALVVNKQPFETNKLTSVPKKYLKYSKEKLLHQTCEPKLSSQ